MNVYSALYLASLAVIVLLPPAAKVPQAAQQKVSQSAVSSLFAYTVTERSLGDNRFEGRLEGFYQAKDGTLRPFPVIVTPPPSPLAALVMHPSGKFLYVYEQAVTMDGDPGDPIAPQTSEVLTFRVEPTGALTELQRLTIPTFLFDLVPRPGGRFLYGMGPSRAPAGMASGLQILGIASNGTLTYQGTTDCIATGTLRTFVGVRDEDDLSFSPDGRFAYAFSGTGFVDHSENHRQIYSIKPDGTFVALGNEEHEGGMMFNDPKPGIGAVTFVPGTHLAIGDGMSKAWLYQLGTEGKLIPLRSLEFADAPSKQKFRSVDVSGALYFTSQGVYRVSPKAGIVPVTGDAFPKDATLVPDPARRFIYAYVNRYDKEQKTWGSQIAVYTLVKGRILRRIGLRPFLSTRVNQIVWAEPQKARQVVR